MKTIFKKNSPNVLKLAALVLWINFDWSIHVIGSTVGIIFIKTVQSIMKFSHTGHDFIFHALVTS